MDHLAGTCTCHDKHFLRLATHCDINVRLTTVRNCCYQQLHFFLDDMAPEVRGQALNQLMIISTQNLSDDILCHIAREPNFDVQANIVRRLDSSLYEWYLEASKDYIYFHNKKLIYQQIDSNLLINYIHEEWEFENRYVIAKRIPIEFAGLMLAISPNNDDCILILRKRLATEQNDK